MYDHSRSNVAIDVSTAVTAVATFVEGFCGYLPTLRALLGGSSRIDTDELDTGTCSLVVEHCGQLSPRGVGNVLGQHCASQAFDVEVFDRYPAKPIDDIAGNLVQVMSSTVSDVGMEPRRGRLALLPGVGAAFAPGDSALPAPKLFGGALRPVWPLLGLSVAQGNQAGESEIDSDAIRTGALDNVNRDVKDDGPLACLPGQDRGGGLARQFPVPADLDIARHTNEAKAAVFADSEAVSDAEFGCVIAGAGAETRKASPASKESFERFVEATQHLLLGTEGPSGQRGGGASYSLQFERLIAILEADAATPVGLNALTKRVR